MNAWTGAIFRNVRAVAGGAAGLLLPNVCASCEGGHVEVGGLCEACGRKLLSLVALPYCPRCGATVGPNIPVREDGCWACPAPLPRWSRVVRLGPYTGPLRTVIRELKFHRREVMRRSLGKLLAQAVATACEADPLDVVLPVPMHWRRRLSRGYDHAGVLARAVAGELGLPVGDDLLRIRHTPPQTSLSRTKRLENVRRAFGLRGGEALAGANILLVDDVTTTGATANEAARTLLRGQANRVVLGVVAKAEPPTAYAEHWAT